MRRLIILIIIIGSIIDAYGQEFFLNYSYANSSLDKFSKANGYDIGFAKVTSKGNKIEVRLHNSFNTKNYDYIKSIPADPQSYIIKEVEPQSTLIRIQANYSFSMHNNDRATIFLGPVAALNYFIINESIHRLENGSITDATYSARDQYNNKLSFGIILSFEIKEIFSKHLNLVYSVIPQVGSFEKFAAMGSIDPWFYSSIDFNLGLRYRFGTKD